MYMCNICVCIYIYIYSMCVCVCNGFSLFCEKQISAFSKPVSKESLPCCLASTHVCSWGLNRLNDRCRYRSVSQLQLVINKEH